MILRSLFCCALLGLSSAANAGLKTKFNQQHYEVSGSTIAQIQQSLARNSPIRVENHQRYAYTRWDVHWQYRWQSHELGCRIEQVDVTLTLNVTLPQWRAPAQVASATRHRWTHFINALSQHEQRHQEYGQRAAQAIEEALWQMGYFSDCQALSKAANAEAQALIDLYAALERRFDQRTRHGDTQGVHLR